MFNKFTYPSYVKSKAPDFIKEFTKEEALYDYDYAWKSIEENYPYLKLLERKGIDYKKIKEEYRQMLENENEISYDFFYFVIRESVGRLQYVGHVNIMDPSYFDLAMESFEKLEVDDDYFKYLYSVVDNEKSSASYDYLKKLFRMGNGGGASITDSGNHIKLKEINGGIKYIRLDSFFQKNVSKDKDKLFKIYSKLDDNDKLIIDIRKNGGGSDFYWIENIVEPNIDVDYEYESTALIKNTSFNKKMLDLAGVQYKIGIENLQIIPNFNYDEFDENVKVTTNKNVIKASGNKKLFKWKIFVLTNKGVFLLQRVLLNFVRILNLLN